MYVDVTSSLSWSPSRSISLLPRNTANAVNTQTSHPDLDMPTYQSPRVVHRIITLVKKLS